VFSVWSERAVVSSNSHVHRVHSAVLQDLQFMGES